MVGTGTRERAGNRAPKPWTPGPRMRPRRDAASTAEAAKPRRRLLLRRGRGGGVELLDDVGRGVEARIGQTTPESTLLKTMWRFLAADTSDSTGRSLRWK